MPSAAGKVFVIAELLEQILLTLDFRTLFKLQRVSQSFRATLSSSIHLQRRMHLEYQPTVNFHNTPCKQDGSHEFDFPDTMLVTFAKHGLLNVQPFEYENDKFSVSDQGVKPKKVIFSLSLPLTRLNVNPDPKIGWQTPSGAIESSANATWKAMKLTHHREPLRIELRIRGPRSSLRYNGMLYFAPGEGRLGEVAAAMERALRRTTLQHKQREDDFLENREWAE